MQYLDYYWNSLLEIPLGWIVGIIPIESAFTGNLVKCVLTLILLWVVYKIFMIEVWGRIRDYRDRGKHWEDLVPAKSYADDEEGEAKEGKEAPAAKPIPPAHFKKKVAQLRKDKDYNGLAALYSAHGKHVRAAFAYKKAGRMKHAAQSLAKGGWTLWAASWMVKAGDLTLAAQLYSQKGRHLKAGQTYEKANDLPNAALSYVKAKKFDLAIGVFGRHTFIGADASGKQAALEQQAAAAEQCLALLSNPKSSQGLDDAQRKGLLEAVARSMEFSDRCETAAGLFRQIGQPERAGTIYLRQGALEKAAQCFSEAGKTREAAEVKGRFFEAAQRWPEAGAAYAQAGQFRRAGDCFSKANDALRASDCYAKAGEYFGAGLALVHLNKWEGAIPLLQKVHESHAHFDESRALLGRCFYELKDYAHSVAALENHLTGKRVESSNIDYYWMLALAYEQLGELVKSRDILLKIHTLDIGFRDASQRLSNINTRISMTAAATPSAFGATGISTASSGDVQATQVMEMVANQLGRRYEFQKELGRGGMGVIYLAKDTVLDRLVALKFLGSLVDGNDEFRKRFEREAKAAAKVNHPNVVSIYDIGTQEGKAFIAMEYIEGGDLSKYLRHKGRLPVREAVNFISQACSALEAVHRAGIVHRDIKPENIVITRGALVKLMDFGLALVPEMRLTGKGVIMGTPLYMSPEQVRGQDIDARGDIYSLGMVLYELLTGSPAFVDGNILQSQCEETPKPPSQKAEGIPQAMDELVMKCLAKNREDRFASAQEMLDALRLIDQAD